MIFLSTHYILRFVYDNSIAYGVKMDQRLDEIRKDREGDLPENPQAPQENRD